MKNSTHPTQHPVRKFCLAAIIFGVLLVVFNLLPLALGYTEELRWGFGFPPAVLAVLALVKLAGLKPGKKLTA